MGKYQQPPRDIFDTINKKLDKMERRLKQLENIGNPTVPVKSSTDPDLIPGQVFITSGGQLAWVTETGEVQRISGL